MPSTPETTDFADWLVAELAERGWNQEQLARRMGVHPGVVSSIINRVKGVGPDTARKIAGVLGVPQLKVFRKAGLIDDPLLDEVEDEDVLSLLKRFMLLPEIKRKMVLSMLEPLLEDEDTEDVERSTRIRKDHSKGLARR